MRVINGFDAHSGTVISVRISNISNDVVTFAGVLKRFEADGGTIEAKWTAKQLVNGVQAQLGDAHGYDVIILPVSQPDSNPTMDAAIQLDDPEGGDSQTVAVGDNIPFGWRIFVD
jgi:hypothetical protein